MLIYYYRVMNLSIIFQRKLCPFFLSDITIFRDINRLREETEISFY